MNTNPFLADLAAIAAQVVVLDDYTYQVRGQRFEVAYQQAYTRWPQPLQHFGQNSGDAGQVRANLRQQLAGALYGTYYCPGTTDEAAASPPSAPLPVPAERARTMALLSAANCTPNGFDPAWTVYSIDGQGNAFVSKNGALRQLVANQWTFANPAETALRVGALVQLTISKEDTTLQPVFYHVRGTELVSQQSEFVRVYFNTTFEGALLLVQGITAAFNEYRLPFLFKCLNHPDLFTRTDSAVLYISKFDFHLAYRLLRPLLTQLAPHLRPAVPLFTRPLRPGVSFCEDPADGQSFGMSRCSLLAEALLAAYDKQLAPGPDQLAEIERVLTQNGLTSERIYLNANSHLSYPLPNLAHEPALAVH
jgi:hypothetical protein